MCGLAGLLAWEERYRITPAELARLSARIAHRGPDGEGAYLNHETIDKAVRGQVGLVHRRLAILDPDPRANQPFGDGQGRWIVFNGEIYNFRDLRQELAAARPDYVWRTECDTEVLLLAYDVWERECLERLNGMFAFAIWDEKAGELFLARDRMGQKPLYYSGVAGGAFAFASELPALREVNWIDATIDSQSLSDYLTWGYTPRGTVYRGIRQLAPGEWMVVSRGGVESGRYFEPNEPIPGSERLENGEAIQRTRKLVINAVRRQLVSDVPLGCFLSGGIDSSIIAAAMRAAVGAGQRVLTFSIGFDDPRYDETPYARAVAEHLHTEHRQFTVRPNAAEDLPKLARVFGEPFADSSALPTHYLSRETRQHVKVALSGDGGDELFGGYDRYRAMILGQWARHVPSMVRSAVSAAAGLAPAHPKSRLTRLRRLLDTVELPPAARYAGYLRLFDAPTIVELMGGMEKHVPVLVESSQRVLTDRYRAMLAREFGGAGYGDLVEAAMGVDRELYLPGDLLTKVDRCSMLHALEVRSPFMDHELVHFAAGLPTELLINGGSKRLLREAFAGDLPTGHFSRPKMGFAVPIGEWFRGSLRSMLRDTIDASGSFASTYLNQRVIGRLIEEHEIRRQDHSQRLYALLMLELWWSYCGTSTSAQASG